MTKLIEKVVHKFFTAIGFLSIIFLIAILIVVLAGPVPNTDAFLIEHGLSSKETRENYQIYKSAENSRKEAEIIGMLSEYGNLEIKKEGIEYNYSKGFLLEWEYDNDMLELERDQEVILQKIRIYMQQNAINIEDLSSPIRRILVEDLSI